MCFMRRPFKRRVSNLQFLEIKKEIDKRMLRELQDVSIFENHLNEMVEGFLKFKKHYNEFFEHFEKTQAQDLEFKKQFEAMFGFPYEKQSKIGIVEMDLEEFFVVEEYGYKWTDKIFKVLFKKFELTSERLDQATSKIKKVLQPTTEKVTEIPDRLITNVPPAPRKDRPPTWKEMQYKYKREREEKDREMLSKWD